MSTMSPGAMRRRTKITTDIPRRVSAAMPRRWARSVFTSGGLLVPPHVLHAAEVVDVVLGNHVVHVRPVREVVEPPVEDGTGRVLLDLLLQGQHQLQAFLVVHLL